MLFKRRKLKDIYDEYTTDFKQFKGYLQLEDKILASVLSGTTFLQEGHIKKALNELHPYTTGSFSILNLWGKIWGVKKQLPTFARGNIKVKGKKGSYLPKNTEYMSHDITYETQEDLFFRENGELSCEIQAKVYGEKANLDPDIMLEMKTAVAGIDSMAITKGKISGGTDAESIDKYRERLLVAVQKAPQGGNKRDYEAWSLEHPLVNRVWVYPKILGVGSVGVAVINDKRPLLKEDLQDIQNVMEAPDKHPVVAQLFVFTPITKKVFFDIKSTGQDFTKNEKIRQEIEFAIKETLQSLSPGEALEISPIIKKIQTTLDKYDSKYSFFLTHTVETKEEKVLFEKDKYTLKIFGGIHYVS